MFEYRCASATAAADPLNPHRVPCPNSDVSLTKSPNAHSLSINAPPLPVHIQKIPSVGSNRSRAHCHHLAFSYVSTNLYTLGNPYPLPVVQTRMPSTEPQYASVGAPVPEETRHASSEYPTLTPMSNSSAHPFYQPDPPFDKRAIPNIRLAPGIPMNPAHSTSPGSHDVLERHLIQRSSFIIPLSRLYSAPPILVPL